jgi:hypothetical protein
MLSGVPQIGSPGLFEAAGRQLIERGFVEDAELAVACDASAAAARLQDGVYRAAQKRG